MLLVQKLGFGLLPCDMVIGRIIAQVLEGEDCDRVGQH